VRDPDPFGAPPFLGPVITSVGEACPAQKLFRQRLDSACGAPSIFRVDLEVGPARKATLARQSLLHLAELGLAHVSREPFAEAVERCLVAAANRPQPAFGVLAQTRERCALNGVGHETFFL
jgi:hypothetical protein